MSRARRAISGFALGFALILLAGCEKAGPALPPAEQRAVDDKKNLEWTERHTRVFRGSDGHQYLVYNQFPQSSGGGGLTHLAGCDHEDCKAARNRAAGR